MNLWIVCNGNLQDAFLDRFIQWMDEAAKNVGFQTTLIPNDALLPLIEGGNTVLGGKWKGERPDGVLFWDKDIQLAYHLERMNIPVFNSASAIEMCDNKALTYQALTNCGISMPKTILSPFVFSNMTRRSYAYLENVEKELGFPLVIKEAFGSYGNQVYLIQDKEELLLKAKELTHIQHVYQEYIKPSHGKDIRLYVVGNEVKATMKRTSHGDFRANTSLGGEMSVFEPTEKQKALAVNVSRQLGLDFSGVDLLFGEEDEMYVCEVNSNATMINFSDMVGIHLGEEIFHYIKQQLQK